MESLLKSTASGLLKQDERYKKRFSKIEHILGQVYNDVKDHKEEHAGDGR